MARIRSIKPEFFTHPVLARLSDAHQILAVALLTHADDHGFFRADPEIVRGACRPYWDSGKLLEGLRKLSQVDWWTPRYHPEQGLLGLITTWDKHQKVSHKKPSKIRRYWDKAISGELPEIFRLDQGTGNREQVGVNAAASPAAATPTLISSDVVKTETKTNRRNLARLLRQLGLQATEDQGDQTGSITEWADLMQGRGECRGVDEVLAGIGWIIAVAGRRGVVIRYAKQAAELADEWAKRIRKEPA